MATTNEELIGRTDINDLEAILAITNNDVDEVAHAVNDNADALFTWDYERTRPALGKLYEKAKKAQWNAQTDLPWETEVDQEAVVVANSLQFGGPGGNVDVADLIYVPQTDSLYAATHGQGVWQLKVQ